MAVGSGVSTLAGIKSGGVRGCLLTRGIAILGCTLGYGVAGRAGEGAAGLRAAVEATAANGLAFAEVGEQEGFLGRGGDVTARLGALFNRPGRRLARAQLARSLS